VDWRDLDTWRKQRVLVREKKKKIFGQWTRKIFAEKERLKRRFRRTKVKTREDKVKKRSSEDFEEGRKVRNRKRKKAFKKVIKNGKIPRFFIGKDLQRRLKDSKKTSRRQVTRNKTRLLWSGKEKDKNKIQDSALQTRCFGKFSVDCNIARC
jgi:hypothetical protein